MDLIFKVIRDEYTHDGKPELQQMETHGASLNLYELRFTWVWATSLAAARAIQRQYRQEW